MRSVNETCECAVSARQSCECAVSARHDIVDAQCQRDMWAHCVSEPCQWNVQVSWVWVLCQSVTINLLQSVCDNQSVTINLLQSVCGNRPHTDARVCGNRSVARGLWQSVSRHPIWRSCVCVCATQTATCMHAHSALKLSRMLSLSPS